MKSETDGRDSNTESGAYGARLLREADDELIDGGALGKAPVIEATWPWTREDEN
ncbi:MAG: hypothetical protein VX466_09340 [Myxococcota bacterium]|nr:hypothetical protein [Myxococcota bacterium]